MISPCSSGPRRGGRRVVFAACYVYSPTGAGPASRRSRWLRELLKTGDPRFVVRCALRIREQVLAGSALAGYLRPDCVLVPVPGSAPRRGSKPVSERLAAALIEVGVGCSIWTGLRRVSAVPKSATAIPGLRPTVGKHYASFAVDTAGTPPAAVVLVDDVVTKGRTLLAAAARLQDAYPHTEIRAFAVLRTMGLVDGIDRLLAPCVGEIRWRHGDAERSP